MQRLDFRAWDREEHTMIQNFANYAGWQAINGFYNAWKMDRYIIDQWTTLTDITGKRVYDGDIMYDWGFGSMTGIAHGCHIIRWGGNGWKHTSSYMDYSKGILSGVVVGNIYENPDLLISGMTITGIEERLDLLKKEWFRRKNERKID